MRTLFILFIVFCSTVSAHAEEKVLPFNLKYYGNFKRMMHTENVAGVVDIKQAISGGHVYAVGAIKNAEGEITVHDGKAWLSYGKDGLDRVTHEIPDGEHAMLLVTARVEEWLNIAVPADMPDHKLYIFILNQAEKKGLSTDAPFPFLIEGPVKDILWHVIDGKSPKSERQGEHAFIKRLINRRQEASLTLIGFYSADIQGVFAHPGESWHTHVIMKDENKAGHVEKFAVGKGSVLKLPAQGQ